jgi:hypothetical protein
MKKIILIGLVIFMNANQRTTAQDFKSLKAITPPAFMILGNEPTTVERPTSPKDFVLSLQNAFVNGAPKQGYAMEMSPGLWFNRDFEKSQKFSYKAYMNEERYGRKVLQSISASFAIVQTDSVVFGSLKTGSSAGYGLKLLLVPGKVNDTTKKLMADLDVDLNYLLPYLNQIYISLLTNSTLNASGFNKASEFNEIYSTAKKNAINNVYKNDSISLTVRSACLIIIDEYSDYVINACNLKIDSKGTINRDFWKTLDPNNPEFTPANIILTKDNKNIKVLNSNKVAFARAGFMLEAAFAGASVVKNDNWDSTVVAKKAFWLTPSYKLNIPIDNKGILNVDAMLLGRRTWNNALVDTSSYWDFGGKLQITFNSISLSGEFVARMADKVRSNVSHWTNRCVGNLEYVISPMVTLKVSIGHTFNGTTTTYDKPQNGFYALGGVNFGVFAAKSN